MEQGAPLRHWTWFNSASARAFASLLRAVKSYLAQLISNWESSTWTWRRLSQGVGVSWKGEEVPVIRRATGVAGGGLVPVEPGSVTGVAVGVSVGALGCFSSPPLSWHEITVKAPIMRNRRGIRIL